MGFSYGKNIEKRSIGDITTPTPTISFKSEIACSEEDELSESPDLKDSLKIIGDNATALSITKKNCIAVFGKLEADLEGNGSNNYIFWGSGIGCASCHTQVVYVLSGDKILFQKDLDDPKFEIIEDKEGKNQLSITEPIRSASEGYCCPTWGLTDIYEWSSASNALLSIKTFPVKY